MGLSVEGSGFDLLFLKSLREGGVGGQGGSWSSEGLGAGVTLQSSGLEAQTASQQGSWSTRPSVCPGLRSQSCFLCSGHIPGGSWASVSHLSSSQGGCPCSLLT